LDPRGAPPAPGAAKHGDRDVQRRRPLRITADRGYAAAKAAIRFICGNAADESSGAGLDIRSVSVLPKLTSATDLGAVAAAAYARRYGIDIDEYVRQQDPPSNPSRLPRHVADLASSTDPAPGAYLLTPDGLSLLP
jgi:hypothetical protein